MIRYMTAALAATALLACGDGKKDDEGHDDDSLAAMAVDSSTMTTASAAMRGPTGADLGSLTLTEQAGAIAISGTLRGIAPGEHGIHLHMVGRCEPPFESAGEHWNPASRKHGLDNTEGPHNGDLPNITASNDSTVTVQLSTPPATLGDLMDADGAALVIHAMRDDQRTDPAGGSGDRIACGAVTR